MTLPIALIGFAVWSLATQQKKRAGRQHCSAHFARFKQKVGIRQLLLLPPELAPALRDALEVSSAEQELINAWTRRSF